MSEENAEYKMVQEAVMCTLMLTLVDTIRGKEEASKNTFRLLYSRSLQLVMDLIHDDLSVVRLKMSKMKIKYWELEHASDYRRYAYTYEGYERQTGFNVDVLKARMRERLRQYEVEVIRRLAQNKKSSKDN